MCENKSFRISDCEFHDGRLVAVNMSKEEAIDKTDFGAAFRTSGCGNCNRPYYNERPGQEFYNFPRKLTNDEWVSCINELNIKFLSNND